jgi:NADPH2:quinone reductase
VGREVTGISVDQRVWFFEAQHNRLLGSAAELVQLPLHCIAPLPDSVTFAEGAALGIPTLTAHRAVSALGCLHGKTVLVTGCLGRVGYYAVQFAQQAGAQVIGSISQVEDLAEATALGIDSVVCHNGGQLSKQLKTALQGELLAGVVEVECGSNICSYADFLATGAVVASYGSQQVPEVSLPFYQLMFRNVTIQTIFVHALDTACKQHAIQVVNKLMSAGLLRHRISRIYPFEQIVKAHQAVEAGYNRGSIILKAPVIQ